MQDPIVEEIHQHRQEMLQSYGGDIRAMFKALMADQFQDGHKVRSPEAEVTTTADN